MQPCSRIYYFSVS